MKGTQAENMYICVQGCIGIYSDSEFEECVVKTQMTAVIGERGFINNEPVRKKSCRAETDS